MAADEDIIHADAHADADNITFRRASRRHDARAQRDAAMLRDAKTRLRHMRDNIC